MQNLILVPADQENLNDTIKTIVSFSEVNNILPTAISDKLRERVNNDDGFYCWAIQRGRKQLIFEQMKVGTFMSLCRKRSPQWMQ